MYNIELRNYILSHSNWEKELSEKPYSLKIQRDGDYIMFKYNQIESDFNNPIVREARGIIFYEPTWECVCHPFNKFGNYGESYCPNIDWNSSFISEKVDGSLIKVWYHNNDWHISTNGTIDAFKSETGNIMFPTFGGLFNCTLIETYDLIPDKFFDSLDKSFTYMFELVSPYNRVVIPYKDKKIYLLGARSKTTGNEIAFKDIHMDFIDKPYIYKMHTLEQTQQAAKELPWDDEGYVVCDKHFNRVKIKSPNYVIAHHARTSKALTQKNLLEIILANEVDEFLIYANEYESIINELKDKMDSINKTCEWFKEKLTNMLNKDKKEYALEIINNYPTYSRPFLFALYDNNDLTFKEYTKDWDKIKWDRLLISVYG